MKYLDEANLDSKMHQLIEKGVKLSILNVKESLTPYENLESAVAFNVKINALSWVMTELLVENCEEDVSKKFLIDLTKQIITMIRKKNGN
jgi:hypothetical protein